jgi:hypothetical protein
MGNVNLFEKDEVKAMSDFELDDRFRKVQRKVQRLGIRFTAMGVGGTYWAPSLINYYGCNVVVEFNPKDVEVGMLNSVRIFCADTGNFICEAWLLSEAYSRYDVRDIRREYRNLLLCRIRELRDIRHGR